MMDEGCVRIFIASRGDIERNNTEFQINMSNDKVEFISQWHQESKEFDWQRAILPRLILLHAKINEKDGTV